MRPIAAAAGCTVIDNSSYFRMDPDVPLIVPEVNPQAIDGYRKRNIIANPNCSTAQMVVALKPLHDAATIKRVVVATYQSVSGAGKAGMDELFEQSRNIFVGDSAEAHDLHQADRLQRHPPYRRLPRRRLDQRGMEDGGRDQEDPRPEDQGQRDLRPRARLRRPFAKRSTSSSRRRSPPRKRRRSCARRPGIMLVDKREDGGYVTPVECVGEYATYVSRVREDPTVDNGLSLWCVSDNLAQGRGAERGPDRRTARPAAPQEGGVTLALEPIARDTDPARLRRGAGARPSAATRGRRARSSSRPSPC